MSRLKLVARLFVVTSAFTGMGCGFGSIATAAILDLQLSTPPRICGLRSGETLTTQLDTLVGAANSSFAIGLSTLQHFPAVQALIKDPDVVKFCASGAVMARNQYGYDLWLMTLEMNMKSGIHRVLPVLLQMASIPAFEGPGVQRLWIGFDRHQLSDAVRDAVRHSYEEGRVAQFQDLAGLGLSPVEFATFILPNQKVVLGTRGFVHVPDVDPGWKTYIVSQLRVIGSVVNPFSAQYLLDAVAVQIRESTGRVRILPLPNFFSAYQNLYVAQALSQPPEISRQSTRETFTQKLRILSE